jgi:hypothetical protein
LKEQVEAAQRAVANWPADVKAAMGLEPSPSAEVLALQSKLDFERQAYAVAANTVADLQSRLHPGVVCESCGKAKHADDMHSDICYGCAWLRDSRRLQECLVVLRESDIGHMYTLDELVLKLQGILVEKPVNLSQAAGAMGLDKIRNEQ